MRLCRIRDDHGYHGYHEPGIDNGDELHRWRRALKYFKSNPKAATSTSVDRYISVERSCSSNSSSTNSSEFRVSEKDNASDSSPDRAISSCRSSCRRCRRNRRREERQRKAATGVMESQDSSTRSWSDRLTTRALALALQLPRYVPTQVLRFTSPEGPYPAVLNLPSRDEGRTISIYVFIPPPQSLASSPLSTHAAQSTAGDAAIDKVPVLVDFHGGSFVRGEPLEQAPWCASLARSGILSISVAYRLAPQYVFPAALHDCEDVMNAVLEPESKAGQFLRNEVLARSTLPEAAPAKDEKAEAEESASSSSSAKPRPVGLDEKRVAMSGFSSGGNVALNLLLSLPAQISQWPNKETPADWPSPFSTSYPNPIPALLFYPSLDVRVAEYERKRPTGMAPPTETELWMGRALRNAYLSPDLVANLRASPGLAPLGVKGGAQGEVDVRQKAHDGQAARDELKKEDEKKAKEQPETSKGGEQGKKNAEDGDGFDSMHPKTRALLILSEFDSLAEQSETWVEVLRASDKLVDDQKTYDPDGIGLGIDRPIVEKQDHSASVRVHRIKGRHHGWTQMPDSFLGEEDRKSKASVMDNARKFVVNMFLEQQ